MNYGILLGIIVILLAPHIVRAEATHSGEFDRPLDDAFRIYSNVSSFPQTVMVTVCVDGTSADILVDGEAIQEFRDRVEKIVQRSRTPLVD
jgi:hypothetical protein